MEKYRRALFALRILICLVGAGLMLDGAILGETTINIATVLGIIGIGLSQITENQTNSRGEQI